MKKEYDEELVRICPNLYSNYLVLHGFGCQDGWYPLIKELSIGLEALILAQLQENRSLFHVSQVKEKFGSLRFYMTQATDAMNELISSAEMKSCAICETCGEPGVLRGIGWYYTACDKHVKNIENIN